MDSRQFPLVSIVIPVYNHEGYVKQALESALNQGYPNLELIIIDDGSKDKSCQVIEETLSTWKEQPGHQRSIQFIRQENKGAHTTINRGLSMAQGEWLTILNSDDYYDLKRIEILMEKISAAKAQLAFSYVVNVDDAGHPLPPEHWWSLWYERTRCDLYLKAPTLGFCLLNHNFAVSTGNLFFSRALFQTVGGFKDLKLMHDWDFLLRALVLTEPLLVREYLYFYRLHPHNTQFQVRDLVAQEQREVYRQYLCGVVPSPPQNKQAPCHWYWPSEFGKWRAKLQMDQGLAAYLTADDPSEDTSTVIELQEHLAQGHPQRSSAKGRPITLISHELSLSGAPKLIADIAARLRLHGYNPRVIGMTDGPMRLELEKNGIPAHTVNRKSRLHTCISLLSILCFRIKGQVIANSTMSWTLFLPLTILRPWQKTIWYIHEAFTPFGFYQGRRGKILALLLKLSKKIAPPRLWFGSHGAQAAWGNTGLPPGEVMYWSGIPKVPMEAPHSPYKHNDKLKHLLAVGNPSIRKGTHFLLKAFLTCLREKRIPEDTMLTIVGFTNTQDPHFIQLSDSVLEAVNSGYQDNFRFVTAVASQALSHFFDKADLFIQPSLQECMPLALLTAMSKGMPIITTDVGGCTEAIIDHQTGYVCAPFDVDGLVHAIEEAVNHPEQSWRYGQKAKERFNHKFSLEITEEAMIKGLKQ